MKDLYSRSIGRYFPSFFSMKIDAEHFGGKMSDRDCSLFVHEYMHFLQSFLSVYGLERMRSDYSVLIRSIEWIKNQNDRIISFPIDTNRLNSITRDNERIIKFTEGETRDVKSIIIREINIINDDQIDEYRQINSVLLTIVTQNMEEEICSFGAREVYEGMAYSIEQLITNDYEGSPDFPYSTAAKVAEFYCPTISQDLRSIVVLCDKALMSSNPGLEFVNIVRWLKEIKYQHESPYELYQLLDLNWEVYDLEKPIKWLDAFISVAEDVRYNFHQILSQSKFEDFHKWIDLIFDFAIWLRTNNPMFWIDLMDGGHVVNNLFFESIVRNIGTPLVETKRYNYFTIPPQYNIDTYCLVYFKVFNQIYKLVTEGHCGCQLFYWCKNCKESVTPDKDCESSPWNHKEKTGELCPYREIWQHWGLNPYTPIRKRQAQLGEPI